MVFLKYIFLFLHLMNIGLIAQSSNNNRKLLFSDPLTQATYATSVQIEQGQISNSCDNNNLDCKSVSILINNHFCKIEINYIGGWRGWIKVKNSPQSVISVGTGKSGGEFYSNGLIKGIERWNICLPVSSGKCNNFWIDIFWCNNCPVNSNNFNNFGIAILPSDGSKTLKLEESYDCNYNKFWQQHNGIPSKTISSECSTINYIKNYEIFNADGNTYTLKYDDGIVGLCIEGKMISISNGVKQIQIDVLPCNGKKITGYCPV